MLVGTTDSLTGRRVARLAREGTQEGVRKALRRLVDEGVVEQREAGNSILYRFNRRHLAAPAIEGLTSLRRVLLAKLTSTFESWSMPPVHASMFGSAARGEGGSGSDIDLLLVRPSAVDAEDPIWREQLDELSTDVESWTGNRASIAEVSQSRLADLRRRRPPIVANFEADALTLYGEDATAILAGDGD